MPKKSRQIGTLLYCRYRKNISVPVNYAILHNKQTQYLVGNSLPQLHVLIFFGFSKLGYWDWIVVGRVSCPIQLYLFMFCRQVKYRKFYEITPVVKSELFFACLYFFISPLFFNWHSGGHHRLDRISKGVWSPYIETFGNCIGISSVEN